MVSFVSSARRQPRQDTPHASHILAKHTHHVSTTTISHRVSSLDVTPQRHSSYHIITYWARLASHGRTPVAQRSAQPAALCSYPPAGAARLGSCLRWRLEVPCGRHLCMEGEKTRENVNGASDLQLLLNEHSHTCTPLIQTTISTYELTRLSTQDMTPQRQRCAGRCAIIPSSSTSSTQAPPLTYPGNPI